MLGLKRRAEELYGEGRSVEEMVNVLFPNPPLRVLLMEQISKKESARESMVKSLLGFRP